MKCTFFCEQGSLDLLGVEYLISVLRNAGHDVAVVFDTLHFKPWECPSEESPGDSALVQAIIDSGCDLALGYINTSNFKRLIHLFTMLKAAKPGLVTCVGGPHASYSHETAISKACIDYLCRGEGEIALMQLIAMLNGGGGALPQGIYRMADGRIEGEGFGALVDDLDQIPYPDKSDYYASLPQIRDIYMAISGRGCYNRCTFCNSNTIRNYYRDEGFNFMRRRSVGDLIGELRQAKAIYKPKFVWFCDDTFIYNKKWLREFAERYSSEIAIPFGCSTIPDFFDEDIVAMLAKAGLTNVEVGIQTLNWDTRSRVFGRRETNDQFSRFVKLLRKYQVYVHSDHILNPWDDRASVMEQIKLYADIKPSYINVFHLQYFPTTGIIDSALADGFLTQDAADQVGEGSRVSYFEGGSSQDHLASQQDLALLIALAPFIPAGLMRVFVDSPRWLGVFGKIPPGIVLPMRAINSLLRKADMFGRAHLRNLLLSVIKRRRPADPAQVAALRGIALAKGPLELKRAKPLAASASQKHEPAAETPADAG